MPMVTQHPRRRRSIVVLLGAAVLAAATMQCRMVTDSVVRPLSEPTRASSCIKSCNDAAQAAVQAEVSLHQANVQACGADTTCLAQEEARHEAAIAAIQNQRKACQNGCHHQGGGGGGR